MQVELLYHTPDPERAIATAARLCYAPVGAVELMEGMSDEQVRKVLKTVLEGGHFSTLEHASYTFAVDGVSRALTHQLVIDCRGKLGVGAGKILEFHASPFQMFSCKR